MSKGKNLEEGKGEGKGGEEGDAVRELRSGDRPGPRGAAGAAPGAGGGARPCPAAPGVRGSGGGRTHTRKDRQTDRHSHTLTRTPRGWVRGHRTPPALGDSAAPGWEGQGERGRVQLSTSLRPKNGVCILGNLFWWLRVCFFLLGVFFFSSLFCFVGDYYDFFFFPPISPPSPLEKLFHKSSISLRRGKKLSVNQMRAFSVLFPPSLPPSPPTPHSSSLSKQNTEKPISEAKAQKDKGVLLQTSQSGAD